MSFNRRQSAIPSLHRFLSVGHTTENESLSNFNDNDKSENGLPSKSPTFHNETNFTTMQEDDNIYPLHKTRSFSLSQSRLDRDNHPICTSTPINSPMVSNNRRPSLNLRRLLQPKMSTSQNIDARQHQQPSHKICRYLQSPETSRVLVKNNNSEISPIIPRNRERSNSLQQFSVVELKSPRKEKDFLHRLNCANNKNEYEDGRDFMFISNQPDPTRQEDVSRIDKISHSLIYLSPSHSSPNDRQLYVNNNNNGFIRKQYDSPDGETPLITFLPPSSTPLFGRRRESLPRANFFLAKSKTTDSVVVGEACVAAPRRTSEFPKTNFHLFGNRGGNKSVGEISNSLSAASTPNTCQRNKNRNRFGSVPSIQTHYAEAERELEYDENDENGQISVGNKFPTTTINSTPATPDLGKNRTPGFMRRSATIAFSKGRKLSGLLGYPLPRR